MAEDAKSLGLKDAEVTRGDSAFPTPNLLFHSIVPGGFWGQKDRLGVSKSLGALLDV